METSTAVVIGIAGVVVIGAAWYVMSSTQPPSMQQQYRAPSPDAGQQVSAGITQGILSFIAQQARSSSSGSTDSRSGSQSATYRDPNATGAYSDVMGSTGTWTGSGNTASGWYVGPRG